MLKHEFFDLDLVQAIKKQNALWKLKKKYWKSD